MQKDEFIKIKRKIRNLKIRYKAIILLASTSVILISALNKNHDRFIISDGYVDNKESISISNLVNFSYPPISSFQEINDSNLNIRIDENREEPDSKSDSTIIEEQGSEEDVVTDKNQEYSLENTDLIIYKYNGEIFYIIDTSRGYNHLKRQQKDKCWQCAHAYASDIFRFSDSENLTGSTVGLTSCDISEILEIAASELINDRPTVIEVNGKPNTNLRHFVTIVGIRKNCDFNNLQQSDFLVLDPAKAKLIRLDTTLSGNNIRRYLINAQNATFRPRGGEDNQYCIEIYNNPDEYLSDTCTRTKV